MRADAILIHTGKDVRKLYFEKKQQEKKAASEKSVTVEDADESEDPTKPSSDEPKSPDQIFQRMLGELEPTEARQGVDFMNHFFQKNRAAFEAANPKDGKKTALQQKLRAKQTSESVSSTAPDSAASDVDEEPEPVQTVQQRAKKADQAFEELVNASSPSKAKSAKDPKKRSKHD